MAIVVAMTLGIGGTTAIVSVMECVFVTPLPFSNPDRLVQLGTSMRTLGSAPEVNALDARDWQAQSRTVPRIGLYDVENVTLVLDGIDTPIAASALLAGAGFTDVLEIHPALGRGFTNEDFAQGAAPVVVLGQRFWRDTFHGDPAVIGRSLRLGAARATIVGVWPDAADRFPAGGTALWTPLTYPADSFLNQRGSIALGALGRMAPDVEVDTARAELAAIAQRLALAYPQTNTGRSAIVESLQPAMVGPIGPMIAVMALSMAAVLAIACANIANLLLAQSSGRSRELAVRAALGATRGRVLRQLTAESLILFTVAGTLGVVMAPSLANVLIAQYPGALPLAADPRIDGRVLLIALGLTLTAAAIATIPQLRSAGRLQIAERLAHTARGLISPGQRRTAHLLIVTQVALSMVLLLGAGALLKTFVRLSTVATGLDAQQIVTMRVTLPSAARANAETTIQFQNAVRDLAAALPGVESAAHAMFLPFAAGGWRDGYARIGTTDAPPNLPMADFFMVSHEYLATLGIAIRRGRAVSSQDDASAAPVLVVNEAFAARAFPGEDAIGRRLQWNNRTWEIVGIAADTRHASLWTGPDPDVYVPRAQNIRANTWLVVRTSRPASAIAAEVSTRLRTLDGSAAITDVRRMSERIGDSASLERFRALITGALGSLALVLAVIGIYSVVSYTVSRSTRDIGIRLALGQTRGSAIRQVLAGIWVVMGFGMTIGASVTLLFGRAIEARIPGMDVRDPVTLLAVSMLFLATATLAAYGPARRASRVDVLDALRAE